jgi:hypothetical protein
MMHTPLPGSSNLSLCRGNWRDRFLFTWGVPWDGYAWGDLDFLLGERANGMPDRGFVQAK